MTWKMLAVGVATMSAAAWLAPSPAQAGDVRVGVHIGVPVPPPPPVVAVAPPRVVVVPGSPVFYAPSGHYNLFVYGGRHYTLHNGAWFYRTSAHRPWTFVGRERVPRPVLAVPVKYYRVPPGHAKKLHFHERGSRGPMRDHRGPGR
jgi:hypothetical protein